MKLRHNNTFFLYKGFYNRYVADIWMWMIFLEWVQKCTIKLFDNSS